MSIERAPDYVWIVPKDSELGRRLASFTPLGLQLLCREFENLFVLKLQITQTDEPSVRNGVFLDVPRFELAFDAHLLLVEHFRAFHQIAFTLGSPPQLPPE
jgi:hypothetical protein